MRLRSTSTATADAIITNPPYTRELMHRLIAHFQRIAPTWLLIDYDWSATKQAAPFMPCCSDIVVLARLKWFEDSKDTGKDNHAWYRFDARHSGGTVLHNNRDQGRGYSFTAHQSCASNAASFTSRSDPVRGSARRRASSAPIARGLA